MVEIMTPKESNVYSKLRSLLTYDSERVEREFESPYFYKHAIPSGLSSTQKINIKVLKDMLSYIMLAPKGSDVYSQFISHAL
jgi:ribosomal protein L32E